MEIRKGMSKEKFVGVAVSTIGLISFMLTHAPAWMVGGKSNTVNVTNISKINAPSNNASAIEKAASQAQTLVDLFSALSTSNPIVQIVFVSFFAISALILLYALKDMIPFT